MKIEVWSDFVCPYCYIGKRRLEVALEKFEGKENVELVFKSFELDPYAKKKYDENIYELIAKKYGISLEESKAVNKQIIEQAKELGLNYNFDDLKYTNTFDAHRISQYAKEEGKMNQLAERILKGYFIESLDISNHDVLLGLAKEVGLDSKKVSEVLNSDKYSEYVRNDESAAAKIGVRGVPYFVINDKYAVSGAQPPEVFLEVLEKISKEEIEVISPSNNDENQKGICIDGKCNI